MKSFILTLLLLSITLQVFAASENLDELSNRIPRKLTNTFYSGESSENNYLWQPQTVYYTDITTGHEVWIMSQTTDKHVVSSYEYGQQPWSADGSKFNLAFEDIGTAAYTYNGGYSPEGMLMILNSDGSAMRVAANAAARVNTHENFTNWDPVRPNVFYQFGRSYEGETGTDANTLYKMTVASDNTITRDAVVDLTPADSTSQVGSLKDGITGDGKYYAAMAWNEGSPMYVIDLSDNSLKLSYNFPDLDTYWGNTLASAQSHDQMFTGNAATGYWFYNVQEGANTWWRWRPWGTDNGAPDHTPDTTAPYDWWVGTDAQKEVQILNGSSAPLPDFTAGALLWSHFVPDRYGKHAAFSNGSNIKPAVMRIDDMTLTANPSSATSYSPQYQAWNGWTDYVAGSSDYGDDSPVSPDVHILKYNGGTSLETLIKVADSHSTITTVHANIGQSPDGTKITTQSNFLSPTSNKFDVLVAVAYCPHPPEIISVSGGVVRFDWRTDQTTSRGYTQRGWPSEATDDPPPPRETSKFRLWKSADGSTGWAPVGTVDANIFSRYNFATGVWTGNKYWEITDPSPGGYYAVTAVEHSGLESHTLSNVFSAAGAQTAAYPADPKGGSGVTSSYNSTLKRHYNIYAKDVTTPTITQQQRISSVPVASGTSYIDWLGNPDGTTKYVVTAVDTQGNESAALGVSFAENATAGQYLVTWTDEVAPEPTCSDGVQNGTEAGIDCGGSCSACSAPPQGNKTLCASIGDCLRRTDGACWSW